MKKFLAIFLIAVIGTQFCSSSIYAYNYAHMSASKSHTTPATSADLLQFELPDGVDELGNNLATELGISYAHSNILNYKTSGDVLKIYSALPNYTSNPIYISNHVLLI